MSNKTIITIRPLEEPTSFGRSYGAFVENDLIDYHFCPNDSFARYDLGERRRNLYEEKFPNGYEVVFINSIKE